MSQVNVALEDTENNSVLADKCGHSVAVGLVTELQSVSRENSQAGICLDGSSMILLLHVLLLCMGREDTETATSRFLPKGDKGC